MRYVAFRGQEDFVAGQSLLPTGLSVISPSATQPPLPAVSSSRIPTPQERAVAAANATGLIIVGIVGAGLLVLLLASG